MGRRRVDPLILLALLGVGLFGGIAWLFNPDPDGDDGDEALVLPLPVDAAPDAGPVLAPPPPPPDPADVALSKPALTRRGKLLQRELRSKRLAQRNEVARDVAIDLVVAPSDSAGALLKPFLRHLRGVRLVASSARGYFVTLRVQHGGDDEKAWVSCSAALSALPNKNLAGSLSARADVAGEGTSKEELIADATQACATSLAQDVSAWLKRR